MRSIGSVFRIRGRGKAPVAAYCSSIEDSFAKNTTLFAPQRVIRLHFSCCWLFLAGVDIDRGCYGLGAEAERSLGPRNFRWPRYWLHLVELPSSELGIVGGSGLMFGQERVKMRRLALSLYRVWVFAPK